MNNTYLSYTESSQDNSKESKLTIHNYCIYFNAISLHKEFKALISETCGFREEKYCLSKTIPLCHALVYNLK